MAGSPRASTLPTSRRRRRYSMAGRELPNLRIDRASQTQRLLVGSGSNLDPLDLIERDLVAGAVVELGGARAFVRGHGLGVFESAAGFEIGGDASRAEHIAAEL